MARKQPALGVIMTMFLGLFGLVACNGESLVEYKLKGKIAIDTHFATKIEDDYTTENWNTMQTTVNEGKIAVERAPNKPTILAIVEETKETMDTILDKRNMADFVLTIEVDDNTKKQSEDFIVEASLKNQSGTDISISYYYSPVEPFIQDWRYPHPPFELPPEPNVVIIKNQEVFLETWKLGAFGYIDPITKEKSSLPVGTHELKFKALIIIDQNEIETWSNTIELIVR